MPNRSLRHHVSPNKFIFFPNSTPLASFPVPLNEASVNQKTISGIWFFPGLFFFLSLIHHVAPSLNEQSPHPVHQYFKYLGTPFLLISLLILLKILHYVPAPQLHAHSSVQWHTMKASWNIACAFLSSLILSLTGSTTNTIIIAVPWTHEASIIHDFACAVPLCLEFPLFQPYHLVHMASTQYFRFTFLIPFWESAHLVFHIYFKAVNYVALYGFMYCFLSNQSMDIYKKEWLGNLLLLLDLSRVRSTPCLLEFCFDIYPLNECLPWILVLLRFPSLLYMSIK